jgi:hypothetical protein
MSTRPSQVKSVTTTINCPHCGREVSWTASAKDAAELARETLARIDGLPVTDLIRPAGGD